MKSQAGLFHVFRMFVTRGGEVFVVVVSRQKAIEMSLLIFFLLVVRKDRVG